MFAETDDPVLSTAEVADRLPIQRRGTLNRLRGLQDEGVLDSKPIGGRNTVWWVAEETDERDDGDGRGDDDRDDQDAGVLEHAEAPTVVDDGPSPTDDAGSESSITNADADDDLLDGVTFPGRGEEQRAVRAAAIRRAYELIRERGEVASGEIQETIWREFKDERLGYSASTSARGPGWTLWDSCVRPALKQLPGVVSPPERGNEWRFESP